MTWWQRRRADAARYALAVRWSLRGTRCWFRPHRVKFGTHPFCVRCGRNAVDNRPADG